MDITRASHNPYAGKKVAVVGDVMVDRFIYGSVERISPEAPIPVVQVNKRTTHLGGGGNVAVNLKTLGAEPLLVGRLGNDELGRAFCEIAGKHGMDSGFLVTGALPTISKTRVIARTQQVVRFDEEQTCALTAEERGQVLAQLRRTREHTDTLIVSDYGKGMVDAALLTEIKNIFAGGTVIVDPKPRAGITYNGVSSMTPNLAEAYGLCGLPKGENTHEAVTQLASLLVRQLQLAFVLVTRSEAGMTLVEANGQTTHIDTRAQEVVDVSGAGDTVIAAFAAGLAAGLKPVQAATLANVAAGVVVGKLGTAWVSWAEMVAAASVVHAHN